MAQKKETEMRDNKTTKTTVRDLRTKKNPKGGAAVPVFAGQPKGREMTLPQS